MEIIYLLAAAIIIGALLGGRTFGETVRKGCGCMAVVLLIFLGLFAFLVIIPNAEPTYDPVEEAAYLTFIATDNCTAYASPDISSNVVGELESGRKYVVQNADRFQYFYEVARSDDIIQYVRKECLTREGHY